ncbi:hypothetical protein V6N13_054140 [Hibiscus sabdariffa]|uniref:Uncharacterized protein n=1 Tax=Hibiscus sabdariffa TaxID=183260 RepID=A0ABR2E243_9ROSI
MIRDVGFWNELQAVHSLVKLIKEMAQVIETERPLVGQCLPLRDDLRTKMKIANPKSRRLVWETYLTEFKTLGKVAVRLIFLHATSCGFKCSWSLLKWAYAHEHSRVGMDRAQKLIFIAAH